MAVNWWHPPERVTSLPPSQRVAFGLVCAEHVLPSFELQVQAYPASLPPSLSIEDYKDCIDAFWAWIPYAGTGLPQCITEDDAYHAYSGLIEGLPFIVTNAYGILWCARNSFYSVQDCVSAGEQALEVVAELIPFFISPRSGSDDPDEDAELQAEWEKAVAAHELARLESRAQADAFEALTAGANPGEVRVAGQAVGQEIAAWTVQEL